jgi:hypothetical protein
MQKTTVMDDQITTFALERVAVADLGGDSFSVQAVIDVNTPAAVIVPSSAITFGSDNFQSTAHGFTTGLKVRIATDDTLPGPLLVATDYFVIVIDADNFKLASTLVLALAGTPINLTNDGVGNQTVTPSAIAGGTIKLQQSDIENPSASASSTDWSDLGSATNITVDASPYLEKDRPTSYWVRVLVTLTAGRISADFYQLVKGDKAG